VNATHAACSDASSGEAGVGAGVGLDVGLGVGGADVEGQALEKSYVSSRILIGKGSTVLRLATVMSWPHLLVPARS
jgi:hypothetical protein